jgi:hypothetical protein
VFTEPRDRGISARSRLLSVRVTSGSLALRLRHIVASLLTIAVRLSGLSIAHFGKSHGLSINVGCERQDAVESPTGSSRN